MDGFGSMLGSGGDTSKEFGRSSATSTIGGDTTGLVFDQKTLIVIAISLAALVVSLVGLWFVMRK